MILNDLISGVELITFGMPPYFFNLVSKSPNVLETLYIVQLSIIIIYLKINKFLLNVLECKIIYTDNFPGKTRIIYFGSLLYF